MIGRRALPLLRCFAGETPLGLAAEEVAAFRPPEAGRPHIAGLLGLPRGDAASSEQRTLALSSRGITALVTVDGPVRIRTLRTDEILTIPGFLERAALAPLIGFAEEEGRVVLLLDVATLAGLAGAAPPQGRPSCRS